MKVFFPLDSQEGGRGPTNPPSEWMGVFLRFWHEAPGNPLDPPLGGPPLPRVKQKSLGGKNVSEMQRIDAKRRKENPPEKGGQDWGGLD